MYVLLPSYSDLTILLTLANGHVSNDTGMESLR